MSSIDELTIALSIDQSTEFKQLLKLLKTFKRDAGEAVRAGRDIGIDASAIKDLKDTLEDIQTRMGLIIPANLSKRTIPLAAGALVRNIEAMGGAREFSKEFLKKFSDVTELQLQYRAKDMEDLINKITDDVEYWLQNLKQIHEGQLTSPKIARFVNAFNQIWGLQETTAGRGLLNAIKRIVGERQAEIVRWILSLTETEWMREVQYKLLTRKRAGEVIPPDLEQKIANLRTDEFEEAWRRNIRAKGGELDKLAAYLGEEVWQIKNIDIGTLEEGERKNKLLYYLYKQLQRFTEVGTKTAPIPDVVPFFESLYKYLPTLIGMKPEELWEGQKEKRVDFVFQKSSELLDKLEEAGLKREDIEGSFGAIVATEAIVDKLDASEKRRFEDIGEKLLLITSKTINIGSQLQGIETVDDSKFRQVELTNLLAKVEGISTSLVEDVSLLKSSTASSVAILQDVISQVKGLQGSIDDNAKKEDMEDLLDTIKEMLETYKKEGLPE